MALAIKLLKNVSMNNGHDGLKREAQKHRIDLETLKDYELVIFVNHNANKFKVYGSGDVFAYHRIKGGRISEDAIQLVPKAFGGQKIHLSKAAKDVLVEIMRGAIRK